VESGVAGNNYLSSVFARLQADGFDCRGPVQHNGASYDGLAVRSRFAPTKFGMSREIYVFRSFDTLRAEDMPPFVDQSFKFALEAGGKGGPPRGLGKAVTVYAVALTNGVDPATAESVRNDAPKKHFAAFVAPVVYDRSRNAIHYFERTPAWGAAYFKGIRRTIEANLAPTA
jgi:hypothetical protein